MNPFAEKQARCALNMTFQICWINKKPLCLVLTNIEASKIPKIFGKNLPLFSDSEPGASDEAFRLLSASLLKNDVVFRTVFIRPEPIDVDSRLDQLEVRAKLFLA